MVEKMEALVAALAGRTTTAQDTADTALQEWADTLAGQQDELSRIVALAEEASPGISEAMLAAHEATFAGVTGLSQRLAAIRRSVKDQLTHVDGEVIGPALNAWAVGVAYSFVTVTNVSWPPRMTRRNAVPPDAMRDSSR